MAVYKKEELSDVTYSIENSDNTNSKVSSLAVSGIRGLPDLFKKIEIRTL